MKQLKISDIEPDSYFYDLDEDMSWDTIAEYVYPNRRGTGFGLDLCCCGAYPDEIQAKFWEIFCAIAERHYKLIGSEPITELITHIFEQVDICEHGGSVGGSWLSVKGRKMVKNIKEYYRRYKETEIIVEEVPHGLIERHETHDTVTDLEADQS